MTGSDFVFDTSAVIELFKGNPVVASKLETITNIKIPTIVLGELYFGVYRSSNPQKHIDQVKQFIENCEVLRVGSDTAEVYAIIKTKLKIKGKPIPENDIWILAIAIQFDLPIVAFDKHFLEIEGLKLEEWK